MLVVELQNIKIIHNFNRENHLKHSKAFSIFYMHFFLKKKQDMCIICLLYIQIFHLWLYWEHFFHAIKYSLIITQH